MEVFRLDGIIEISHSLYFLYFFSDYNKSDDQSQIVGNKYTKKKYEIFL